MKNSRTYFTLIGSMILILSISCKKDNTQNQTSQEKKWTVTTIAGEGSPSFADGPALSAKFHFPEDVTVTNDGTIYVTDAGNSRIRKIAAGEVSNFAGSNLGFVNGNGPAAQFKYPFSITADANGNIYSSDARDSRVRKLTVAANVSTYAGTDEEGFKDGAIAIARFGEEIRVVSDAEGNIYIADSQNNRIRKISVSGTVSTIAGSDTAGFKDGSGEKAQFDFPDGIAIDKQGNLYVADGGNYRIRKITPNGQVSTFAGRSEFGFADGDVNTARFDYPTDMVIDNDGNLYVIDVSRIRKISPQGFVFTIAGSLDGYIDGDGTVAQFQTPDGLGIDKEGNIYIADTNNNRIRKISSK
jgi:serine/threonine-protein kinase